LNPKLFGKGVDDSDAATFGGALDEDTEV